MGTWYHWLKNWANLPTQENPWGCPLACNRSYTHLRRDFWEILSRKWGRESSFLVIVAHGATRQPPWQEGEGFMDCDKIMFLWTSPGLNNILNRWIGYQMPIVESYPGFWFSRLMVAEILRKSEAINKERIILSSKGKWAWIWPSWTLWRFVQCGSPQWCLRLQSCDYLYNDRNKLLLLDSIISPFA
jgi:hypothetical protein